MKIKNLLIIFITALSSVLQAQTATEDLVNMKKYWYYHYRMINDFMAKGDCQGCSEILNERDLSELHIAKWGDQTCNTGAYMGVLATEYELLRQQSQPTDSTIEELYYVIRAFNRLDGAAEASLPPHTRPTNISTIVSSNINGFFIRDDVYSNFLIDHPKLAAGVTSSRTVSSIESDFSDPSEPRLKEMSHDQIWHIMMGLALIRKYIPPGQSYLSKPLNNYNLNTDMWQEAQDIATRILTRLKTDSWVIYNPNTGAKVLRGPEVKTLSYGAAEAGCYVDNLNTTPTGLPIPIHSCNDYHDGYTYMLAPIWMEYGRGIGTLISVSQEDLKVQMLAAIGNSWYTSPTLVVPDPVEIISLIFDPYNFWHPFQFITELVTNPPIYPINVTAIELGQRAAIRDYQYLPLLRQVLHGGINTIPNSTYINLLNSAPCEGPYYYGAANSAPFEWSASNRLVHPEQRGGGSAKAEYSGLDYLLYYNLYHLVIPNTVPMVNYMDRVITFPFPSSGTFPVGTASNPALIEAFNTITASNVLNASSYVTYRAGTEVKLKPGFVAYTGCNFRAYTEPFNCSAGEYRSTETFNPYNEPTTAVYYPERILTTLPPTDSNYESIVTNYEKISDSNPLQLEIKSKTIVIPNPSEGVFEVKYLNQGELDKIKTLEISNIMGNTIWKSESNYTASVIIDISNVAQGIYYLKCTNTLNEIEVLKLIKK